MSGRDPGAPPTTALLHADGLTVRYRTRRSPAVCNVSLRLGRGARVLLGGSSGSGKSTLALCLAGLVPDSVDAEASGVLELDGRSLISGPDPQGTRVGIVFQDPASQFTMLTVADEVAFGLENHGVDPADMQRRCDAALAAVGLADRAGWRLDRLSGGQQQRVVVAATLALRPEVLVLDEPAAHLDPASAARLYADLATLADDRGATLVVTEHQVDLVVGDVLDRAIVMAPDGRLALDGPVADLLGDSSAVDRWAALGVALPTPVAFARAAGWTGRPPHDVDTAVTRLAGDAGAQRRLRDAAARRDGVTPGDPVVRARGVEVRHPGPRGGVTAVRDVDLDVNAGELVAVVGRNGSGKTTLLRVLSGLLPPTHGSVAVDGHQLSRLDARTTARTVGHVFQNPESGFVTQTVADELAYGPRALGWAPARIAEHTRAALERFGLAGLGRASPWTLSGGQKRRLSVAVALLTGPRVLMLDEPTFGQDPATAAALARQIRGLVDDGLAVVVATHDTAFAWEHADRVIGLADGVVAYDGPPWRLYDDPQLLDLTGQRPPPLRALLSAARSAGIDVPRSLRWHDLAGVLFDAR